MPKQVLTRSQSDASGFQRLLDKVPAGAYLCDADGLITYFNAHAVELWGRAPTLNDSVDRFCGSFRLFTVDGQSIPHDECWMALALKNDKEYNGQEIVIERPDGVRCTALAHASPFYDDAGRLGGAVNILVDITDRKGAERANALLGAIVESSDDAIVSKSLDGVIQTWNAGAERIFGYSADEAIGRHITLIIPPDMHDEEQVILSRLRRGERIEHYETTRVAKDGRRLDISATISPIVDSARRIIGASKIGRDITLRKQSEAELIALKNQLQEANHRKDEFLAMLAHELRNPLAAICNSLQLLRLDDSLGHSVDKIRGIMEQQSAHMVRLVDDLLDASRISRGQIELRRETIDLASVVANAVQAARPLIDQAGHRLAISVPSEPLLLEADSVRLAQVVGNLLCNAAKYTPRGGQIWLIGKRVEDGVELLVRDTGAGIDADLLPRIFDMFMQIESSKPHSLGGLGLGLALARKIVELHDGRIEAISPGIGQGSEFRVWLPASLLRRQPSSSAIALAAKGPAASAKRILVVDDMNDAVFILSSLLKKLGHEVETARDAMSAMEAVRRLRPEIVFSDIAMPGVDGYELARRLRQMPESAGVTLVALTGYGQQSDRQRAAEAGFDHHLVKPVGIGDLRELLTSVDPAHRGISAR